MKILEKGEESKFTDFMNEICTAVFMESYKSVEELKATDLNPMDNTEEIGASMGQIVLDKMIEMTKHMSRDELMKWFAEIAIMHATSFMQRHPEYKMLIAMQNGLM